MDSITRKSNFHVEIKRPNYKQSTYRPGGAITIGLFGSGLTDLREPTPVHALISYSYKESMRVLDSGFTLSFVPIADGDGLTWFDKIHIGDIVTIREMKRTKFVGMVSDRQYSTTMTEEGALRTISISGAGLGNLLSSFNLIINTYLYKSAAFAEVETTSLMAKLTQMMEDGAQVAPILKVICDSFFKLVLETGNMNRAGIGVKALIDYYIDFNTELSSEVVLRYPMALSLYKTGENNIWNLLSNIVVPPINELFPRFDPDTGKYHIVFRQAPFEPADWKELPLNKIPPILMTSCNFGSNDSDIYTYYLAIMAGSYMTEGLAMVLDAGDYAQLAVTDEEKWPRYGYKPMIVEFKYFNKDKYDTFSQLAYIVREASLMLYRWYEHNDEFLSGGMEFMTVDEKWTSVRIPGMIFDIKDPRIGERLEFLEGQFYIEAVDHSWSYEEAMVTKLSLSRGFIYDGTGKLLKAIPNPGRKVEATLKKGVDTHMTAESMRKKYYS